MIPASVILSQYTRGLDRRTDRRQMAHYDNSRTLQCHYNFWLKSKHNLPRVLNIVSAVCLSKPALEDCVYLLHYFLLVKLFALPAVFVW